MFEAVAAEILAAVQERRAQRGAGHLDSGRWRSVRDGCEEIIVFLEICRRQALANRVERGYDRLKQAWHEPVASAGDEERLTDAAEALSRTLSFLEKYRRHLGQAGAAREKPGLTGPTASSLQSGADRRGTRHKWRGLETTRRLQAHVGERQILYKRLARRILEGDDGAVSEFRDEFGPTALATRWAAEEGEPADGPAVNRWCTAIKGAKFYRDMIQPLLARPPQAPMNWAAIARDASWDEIL